MKQVLSLWWAQGGCWVGAGGSQALASVADLWHSGAHLCAMMSFVAAMDRSVLLM